MRPIALSMLLLSMAACGAQTVGPPPTTSLDAGLADGAGATPGLDSGASPDAADAGAGREDDADAGGSPATDSGAPSADAGALDAGPGATARQIVAGGGRLVDVRTAEEYAAGHIEGALNFPLANLSNHLAELEPKDRWVVVYCRSGGRSAQAAALLTREGFSRVFDLGPMSNW